MGKILTISIAAYNVEKTLSETLDSLLIGSIVDDIEIIIVNDESSDHTLEIAKKYKTQYPESIHIIDKKNGGHGSTINASLKIASGKYYKIVDGDDWVDKEGFEQLIADLKKSNTDLVLNEYIAVYVKKGKEETMRRGKYYDGTEREIKDVLDRYISMHEITIKTALIKNHAPQIEENCYYVDREFVHYCIFFAETFVENPYPVYRYRLGNADQSVSPKNRFEKVENQERCFFKLLKWYSLNKTICNQEKEKWIRTDLYDLLSYIIRSYAFRSDGKNYLSAKRLRELFSIIQKEYNCFYLDKRSIAFKGRKEGSITGILMCVYLYFVLVFNFHGFSLWAKVKQIKLQRSI